MANYQPVGNETWILIDNADTTVADIGNFNGLADGSQLTASNNMGTTTW